MSEELHESFPVDEEQFREQIEQHREGREIMTDIIKESEKTLKTGRSLSEHQTALQEAGEERLYGLLFGN